MGILKDNFKHIEMMIPEDNLFLVYLSRLTSFYGSPRGPYFGCICDGEIPVNSDEIHSLSSIILLVEINLDWLCGLHDRMFQQIL